MFRDADELARSEVVANARMNRGRGLAGTNSYERELRVDLTSLLKDRLSVTRELAWLDLCCGRGLALIEAACLLGSDPNGAGARLVGLDLVGDFLPAPPGSLPVEWITGVLPEALPVGPFDLVTCVHGLHYVGDKLGLLARIAAIVADDGLFLGSIDHTNIKGQNGRTLRGVLGWLDTPPISYSPNTHVVMMGGGAGVEQPYLFTGADDTAGPNHTGQPAVDSYYR